MSIKSVEDSCVFACCEVSGAMGFTLESSLETIMGDCVLVGRMAEGIFGVARLLGVLLAAILV